YPDVSDQFGDAADTHHTHHQQHHNHPNYHQTNLHKFYKAHKKMPAFRGRRGWCGCLQQRPGSGHNLSRYHDAEMPGQPTNRPILHNRGPIEPAVIAW
uniref:Uncharacterized protein n=1 Tax=Anopheles albimanus TaxID=7167 RepID=A0A182FQP9_ANOAL